MWCVASSNDFPRWLQTVTNRYLTDLIRFDKGVRIEAVRLLVVLEERLADIIARVARRDRQFAALQDTQQELKEAVREYYAKDLPGIVGPALAEVSLTAAHVAVDTVNDFAEARLFRPGRSDKRLRQIADDLIVQGQTPVEWRDGAMGAHYRDIMGEMRTAITARDDYQGMVARLRTITGRASRRIETRIRTAVMTAANNARMEMYTANSALIQSLYVMSALDRRLCRLCAPLDTGIEWTIEREPIEHAQVLVVPVHPNCRCIIGIRLVPALEIPGGDQIPEAKRASMDGPVPKSLTAENWLRGQPVDVQNEVLGQAVAELWRRGQIKNLRQTITEQNRPITTAELLRRHVRN